jgi:hydroxymethylpyrimidine pyrophosphatase-like HAD family hydrolase
MFSDVLLTVDFDRTLTAPDSTIPERNMEAIR